MRLSIPSYFFLSFILLACNANDSEKSTNINVADLHTKSTKIDQEVLLKIDSLIKQARLNNYFINTSVSISCGENVSQFYQLRQFQPAWSDTGKLIPSAYHLIDFIDTALYVGLDPSTYHRQELINYKKKKNTSKYTSQQLAACDLLLTDAFFQISSDLKQGRLIADSMKWTHQPNQLVDFFLPQWNAFMKSNDVNKYFQSLEPQFSPYQQLKKGIRTFVNRMDTMNYTRLVYPYKVSDSLDSLAFIKNLHTRFQESRKMHFTFEELLDSLSLSEVVKKYQTQNGLPVDGKINKKLVNHLNQTDLEQLHRIFISLDRYKMIVDSLPDHFIWVNLPSFKLNIYNHDSVTFSSNIVCGKPSTPTPLLTSYLEEIITYPTWTVPPGIIKKEMIPGLKKNNNYLKKKGLKLYDQEGKLVDPSGVDWSKYKNGIPYKIIQGSGEKNALGVIKFNFANPYFVYMHDTNQRGLFKNAMRALSHGCVRIENWKSMAHYLARNDSIMNVALDTLTYNVDSIDRWIENRRSKRIHVKSPIKLFFQYVTCEGDSTGVKFYDDIYGFDKTMLDHYFNRK